MKLSQYKVKLFFTCRVDSGHVGRIVTQSIGAGSIARWNSRMVFTYGAASC